MSEQDDKKPIIEVTEESWEEDTDDVDVLQLEQSRLQAEPDAPPSAPVLTQRSGDSESKVPTPLVDLDAPASDEAPPSEELTEAIVPEVAQEECMLPPSPSARTSVHPVVSEPLIIESNPPPSIPSVFPESHGALSSLSVGQHFARARRIGTGIWYAGVVLWSYLIVGELVVSAGLPEVVGYMAFVGIVVGAFLQGANRVGIVAMRKLAALSVGADVFGVLLLSSIIGSSRRSEYQALSFGLLLISVGLVLWGIRFSRGGLPKPLGAPGINWPRLVVWALFFGPTLLIGAALLS